MDSISSFFNIIVSAFTTAIVDIFFVHRAQKYRELTVSVETLKRPEEDLIHPGLTEFKEHIFVQYGNRDLSQTAVVKVSLKNTGKAPIRETDFVLPPTFDFGTYAELTDAKLLDYSPPALRNSIDLRLENNELMLNSLLLNRSEMLSFAVLGENIGSIRPLIRLEGMAEIRAGEIARLLESIFRSDRSLVAQILAPMLTLIILFTMTSLFFFTAFTVAAAPENYAFLFSPELDNFRYGFIIAFIVFFVTGYIARVLLTARSKIVYYFDQITEMSTKGEIFKYSDK